MINTEKFYKEVIKLKELCDEEIQKHIENRVKLNERNNKPFVLWEQIANLIIDLRAEAAEQSVKAKGKNALFKYCQNMLKNNLGREALSYAKVLSDGYQYVCDGYRAVKMKTALPLPECPKEIGYPALDRVIPNGLTNFEELTDLPAVSRLKAYYKICKAEKKNISYNQGVYKIRNYYINAKWLYEVMEVLPNAKVYSDNSFSLRFLFVDEEQDITVLLMGIRSNALTKYEDIEVA